MSIWCTVPACKFAGRPKLELFLRIFSAVAANYRIITNYPENVKDRKKLLEKKSICFARH